MNFDRSSQSGSSRAENRSDFFRNFFAQAFERARGSRGSRGSRSNFSQFSRFASFSFSRGGKTQNQSLSVRSGSQSITIIRGQSITSAGSPVATGVANGFSFNNQGSASSTGATSTVQLDGKNGTVNNGRGATISAEDTGVGISGRNNTVNNQGTISGDVNAINFENGGKSSGRVNNSGTISSDSRGINIGGEGIRVNNQGSIVGTGDQRNGVIYTDATSNNTTVNNSRGGVIDAGKGNQGAGVVFENGDKAGEAINSTLNNQGTIAGRGQAPAGGGTAGDGVRIFSPVEGTSFNGNINNSGTISSESNVGPTAGVRVTNGVSFNGQINNNREGTISGANNGVYFGTGQHNATVNNSGTISSDSRAVNIDGEGVTLNNNGTIVGTGDQRNGAVYSDATADNFVIRNNSKGTIDAGKGNQGAGVALQTGSESGDVVNAEVSNSGTIQGRGSADPASGLAGDGIRVFSGAPGGNTTFEGNITNRGTIDSESTAGPTAGIRVTNGTNFDGTITNERGGTISGANNGVYFGTGQHDATVNNRGTISSDSRAVNIDGEGVALKNSGTIVGTGDQRNGTVYSDATADNFSIRNERQGTIDAGKGNDGAGIALQTGSEAGDVVNADVVNRGTITGRGQAAATGGTAGDGVRIFAGAEGGTTFKGDLTNSGSITSESNVGPTSGVRVANGVGFDGTITNERGGTISGANNGLYFGTGQHDATVNNRGTISSDSRAVNIDGEGVSLNNSGTILGTGDQRNGTVYSDATADNFSIRNERKGTIDAGKGNDGAGIALQTGSEAGDVVNADIVNRGTITGRGQAAATGGTAGDGVRIFAGAEGGTTFKGDLTNSGSITSESNVGPTSGVRVANGVGFDGTITNERGGTIAGANNGLYFGTGQHDATVNNKGTISSDSRAVNIDGDGVDLNNSGRIIGTGDQRNGTVYADATANDYSITNTRRGTIDAGRGNNGSGVSLQTGDTDGETVSGSVNNAGRIIGRGDAAEGNGVGDGVRIFGGGADNVTFSGDITNSGKISASRGSDEAVGISIEDGISLDGAIKNSGTIRANETAIDATGAGGSVNVVNSGRIIGDVNLSAGDDVFDGSEGRTNGVIRGGAGNDKIIGGDGIDTAAYDDIDVSVTVDLEAGTATRETGFSIASENQPLKSLTTDQTPQQLVDEAAAGNFYYNVHTTEFNGGEIRGQLIPVSDVTDQYGVRTLTLSADLDAAQEPGPTSDSAATGQGTVVITQNGDKVTYSSNLSIQGIESSELQPVAGVSAIHLHNAPAGENGPVITDIVQDAGGDVNGAAQSADADTGDGDVFNEVIETDTLESIERIIGSDDGVNFVGAQVPAGDFDFRAY